MTLLLLKLYYLYSAYAEQLLVYVLLCVIDPSIQVILTKSLEVTKPLEISSSLSI